MFMSALGQLMHMRLYTANYLSQYISMNWLIVVLRRFQQFQFSVISRRSLSKLPVLLVILSWHQPVSCNANPATLSAKGAALTTIFKVLIAMKNRITILLKQAKRAKQEYNSYFLYKKLIKIMRFYIFTFRIRDKSIYNVEILIYFNIKS